MNYQIEIINSSSKGHKNLYANLARLTSPMSDVYPDYKEWLFKKFFPGLKDGSRKMVVAYNNDNPNNPVGVALLKDTQEEKKICCLFVREDCRGQGIASKLMKKSFESLKTEKPLMTVSNNNLSQLQRLLDKNNFEFSYKRKGAYQENNTENYFNNEATEILKKEVLAPLFAYKSKER